MYIFQVKLKLATWPYCDCEQCFMMHTQCNVSGMKFFNHLLSTMNKPRKCIETDCTLLTTTFCRHAIPNNTIQASATTTKQYAQ